MAQWNSTKERNIKIKELRKLGVSIPNIAMQLNCSKATVSLHCKDIKLSNAKLSKLINNSKQSQKIATEAAQRKWSNIKVQAENDAEINWNFVKSDPELLSLVALYWAEGSKRNHNWFTLTNSDPGVILISIKSLTKLGIEKSRLKLTVTIFTSQSELDTKTEWEKITGIKTIVNSRAKRTNRKLYSKYGVAALYVTKSSTLYYKIMKWISLWRMESNVKEGWQL